MISFNTFRSIDGWLWPKLKNAHVPLWNYFLFRTQVTTNNYLTLTGLEGHICPSLVKDWKDIYVLLLSHHGDVIMLPFRAPCIWWCNKNYYIVISGP